MTKAMQKRIERKVAKLRASHDALGHLIESDNNAAHRLLDRTRDELYDLVAALRSQKKLQ